MDILAVYDDDIVFCQRRTALPGGQRALKPAMDGIIFQLIDEMPRVGSYIRYCHNVKFFSHYSLFYHRPKSESPDSAESVDANFDSHVN